MRDDFMLDREVVRDFLLEKSKESSINIPESIDRRKLVEAFCRFTEDDYYEWLKDNFKSFFNHGNPNWEWIEERIAKVK
jgi:nuclear transport factor 2 (NTF2) superfamily protein